MTIEELNKANKIKAKIDKLRMSLAMVNRSSSAQQAKIMLINQLEIEALEEENKVLEFINTINDSRTRRILHYKYIDGYSRQKIARLLHCDVSYPNKLVLKMFTEKNSNITAADITKSNKY